MLGQGVTYGLQLVIRSGCSCVCYNSSCLISRPALKVVAVWRGYGVVSVGETQPLTQLCDSSLGPMCVTGVAVRLVPILCRLM